MVEMRAYMILDSRGGLRTSVTLGYCLWPCSLAVPVQAGWVYGFVVLCPGTPEGSTGNCSGFKASQKMGQQL